MELQVCEGCGICVEQRDNGTCPNCGFDMSSNAPTPQTVRNDDTNVNRQAFKDVSRARRAYLVFGAFFTFCGTFLAVAVAIVSYSSTRGGTILIYGSLPLVIGLVSLVIGLTLKSKSGESRAIAQARSQYSAWEPTCPG